VALPPLPDEEYPRQFPKKTRNLAYWFVRLVILGVESIMPLAL
jgi:hypothetical protein